MPFEHFDKIIKDAADHHHPAYDEKAWAKMEKLLDKHLPQKDDNRRRVFFIILLFLGLGSAGLLITKPWKKSKDTIVSTHPPIKDKDQLVLPGETGKSEKIPQDQNQSNSKDDQTTQASADDVQGVPTGVAPNPVDPNSNRNLVIANNGAPVEKTSVLNRTPTSGELNKKNKMAGTKPISPVGKSKKDRFLVADDKTNTDPSPVLKEQNTKITGTKTSEPTIKVADVAVAEKKKNDLELNKGTVKVEEAKTAGNNEHINVAKKKEQSQKDLAPIVEENKQQIKPEGPVVANNTDKKTKNKRKKINAFFFSVSAGPDVSFVSNNKAGEVKAVVGAGLGYTLKDRWTVRTGFYSGRKVYTATADAYDPPAGFSALYPYLEKVDADCKIYEIPVLLSYDFGKKSARNWFVSAGLSTFLMKEETYNYYYKYTPQGNTYTNKWTIKGKNSHFFSVATLSMGYKKDISKRVTLVAEPYLKIPVGGVGYGKVKLNSGGVLFTIGIKPF